MWSAEVAALRDERAPEMMITMRIALSLAAGILMAGVGLCAVPAPAAPAMPPSDAIAGSAVAQARMHHRKRHYRRSPQRVMGLVPGPGRARVRRR